MKNWFFIMVYLGALLAGKAQTQTNPIDSGKLFFVGASIHQANIITDSRKLQSFTGTHPQLMQLEFGIINNTQRSWKECMCYSKAGLSFTYINFNNNHKLGKGFTPALFMEPYLLYKSKFQLSLRGQAGVSYLTKVYDKQTNPDNLFYSKPISFFLSLGLHANLQISSSISSTLGVQFIHISNGGTQNPNYGINFPSLSIGINYQLNNQLLIPRTPVKLTSRPLKLVVTSFTGQHLEVNEKKLVTGISIGVLKQVSRINGIGLGGEIVYDPIYNVVEEKRGEPYNIIIGAISVQHYFYFKKLLFGQHLLYELASPQSDYRKVFQRYVLGYAVSKNWYAGVSLKAHLGISDYLSISISKVILVTGN